MPYIQDFPVPQGATLDVDFLIVPPGDVSLAGGRVLWGAWEQSFGVPITADPFGTPLGPLITKDSEHGEIDILESPESFTVHLLDADTALLDARQLLPRSPRHRRQWQRHACHPRHDDGDAVAHRGARPMSQVINSVTFKDCFAPLQERAGFAHRVRHRGGGALGRLYVGQYQTIGMLYMTAHILMVETDARGQRHGSGGGRASFAGVLSVTYKNGAKAVEPDLDDLSTTYYGQRVQDIMCAHLPAVVAMHQMTHGRR